MTRGEMFEKAAGDLASELAIMHATLLNLIVALSVTELTSLQTKAINLAAYKLGKSRSRFFATYADMIGGGAAPERN